MRMAARLVLPSDDFALSWKRRKFGIAIAAKNSDDGDDDHEFDERKPALAVVKLLHDV